MQGGEQDEPKGDRQGTGLECYRCKSRTHYSKRILDPTTSKKYDLYECTVCGNQTWSPVTERKSEDRD